MELSLAKKEEYMKPLNSFVHKNKQLLADYFLEVANVVEAPVQGSVKLNIHTVEIEDLFELHRLLFKHRSKLITLLTLARDAAPDNDGLSCTSLSEDAREKTIAMLSNLANPPPISYDLPETDEMSLRRSGPVPLDSELIETSDLERARFLYGGPPTKQGLPVFYLIVNRIKLEHIHNVNPLITFIFKTMTEHVNDRYVLVVDMSWASISGNIKGFIYNHLDKLSGFFSRKYKKNLDTVYIVHPNAYTRAVAHFIKSYTSRNFIKKVKEIYNWKDLANDIPMNHIMLPNSSKDFITKAYHVNKINAKGKIQTRLIKLTANSLLNIEPKTNVIKNEKELTEIVSITIFKNSTEIHFAFSDEHESSSKIGRPSGFLTKMIPSSSQDVTYRIYNCQSISDRNNVVCDLFRVAFKMSTIEQPQQYKVVKVNNAGKHQRRVFKLTCDALLNVDGVNKIKSEFSFAGIEFVKQDPKFDDVIQMKIKGEDYPREIHCDNTTELVGALVKSMESYQQEREYEDNAEKERTRTYTHTTAIPPDSI